MSVVAGFEGAVHGDDEIARTRIAAITTIAGRLARMFTRKTTPLAVVVLFVAAVSLLTARSAATSTSDAAALLRPLAAAVERGDVPGVVATVVDRNRVLYEGAFGKLDVAHDVNMRTDAIFRIASMTKPVTSVAALMLVEEGKLGLDDPVSKYLPGFDNLQVIASFNEPDGTYRTRPRSAR